MRRSKKQFKILLVYLALGILMTPLSVTAQTDNVDSFVEGEPDIIDLIENNPSPIDDFFNDIFETINPILDQTKVVIGQINSGSLEDAILTTLGAVGLIDPVEEANSVSTSEESVYSNPQSVEEVIEQANAADAQESQVSERLSQIVFGSQGQEAINNQNKVIGATQTSSAQAQLATSAVYETARDIAIDNYDNADQIAIQAAEAQAANASQDVLKALAAQNQHMAEINSGVSEQLALLGEAQIYNAVQMDGLNEQLTISNQRQQNIETFLASSNSQLAEIDRNQELQTSNLIESQNRERLRSRQGMTRIFVRGLFPEESQVTQPENNNQNNLEVITASSEQNFFSDLSNILNQ